MIYKAINCEDILTNINGLYTGGASGTSNDGTARDWATEAALIGSEGPNVLWGQYIDRYAAYDADQAAIGENTVVHPDVYKLADSDNNMIAMFTARKGIYYRTGQPECFPGDIFP